MTAQWEPGTLYAPGDVVTPRLTDPITQDKLTNGDFEAAGGWDETGLFEITTGDSFEGSQKIEVIAPGAYAAIASADDVDNVARSLLGVTWIPESIDPGVVFAGSSPQIAFASYELIEYRVICHSGPPESRNSCRVYPNHTVV